MATDVDTSPLFSKVFQLFAFHLFRTLFSLMPGFAIGLFVFLMFNLSCLWIPDTNPLSDAYLEKLFLLVSLSCHSSDGVLCCMECFAS